MLSCRAWYLVSSTSALQLALGVEALGVVALGVVALDAGVDVGSLVLVDPVGRCPFG